jgi:hypothetical protein
LLQNRGAILSRVILERLSTYVAMAVGVLLGYIHYFGISGFAAVVILAAAVVALAFILILRIYLQQPAALPRT